MFFVAPQYYLFLYEKYKRMYTYFLQGKGNTFEWSITQDISHFFQSNNPEKLRVLDMFCSSHIPNDFNWQGNDMMPISF